MGLPRSRYVKEGEEGVYHCFSRCVRRAFLCGYDPLTGRDFSHRKKLIVDRLRHLAAVFAIEVCAYAIMENHSHVILRLRPDIVAAWSDQEVATRWLELFPQKRRIKGKPIPPLEEQIQALADCPERIAVLRKRLCSLSWFMGQLNEFIARAANKEDKVTGRFWEGRFKSQALLDEAGLLRKKATIPASRNGSAAGKRKQWPQTPIQGRKYKPCDPSLPEKNPPKILPPQLPNTFLPQVLLQRMPTAGYARFNPIPPGAGFCR